MVQECVEAGENLGPRGCTECGGLAGWEVSLGEIQIGFGACCCNASSRACGQRAA